MVELGDDGFAGLFGEDAADGVDFFPHFHGGEIDVGPPVELHADK